MCVGRELRELARQRYDRRMRRLEERIVERQLDHLVVSGLRQLLTSVADVARPKTRHAVEDAIAFAVDDVGAFALDDDAHARTCPQRLMVGEGMQVVQSVELLNLLCLKSVGHGSGLQRNR